VPKKVEQINDHLFIDTYKSNSITIGVNDMTVNDSEMSVRWKRQAYYLYHETLYGKVMETLHTTHFNTGQLDGDAVYNFTLLFIAVIASK